MASQRIVSLVPSLTELLAALGLDAEVVGLTRFCVHPEGWKARKTIVGGTKNVDVDRVRSLAPSLVIANQEENVREQVEAIGAFAPVLLTEPGTVDGALLAIRTIGTAVGREAEAEALADEISRAFDTLAEASGARGEPPGSLHPSASRIPPLRTLYLIWRDPWMTVGGDTYVSDVMARGGFANVCSNRERYPTLTAREIQRLAPEIIMLSSEPYPFAAQHIAELQPQAPEAAVMLVDGEAFSWYGPRMALAPGAMSALRRRLLG